MNNEYQEALKKNVIFVIFRKKYTWDQFLNGDG